MQKFELDVTCQNKPMFLNAIQIAFCRDRLMPSSVPLGVSGDNIDGYPNSQAATHYQVNKEGRFILFSGVPDDLPKDTATLLPYPLEWRQAAEMAWSWVVHHAEYKPSGHSGDAWSQRAWRVCAGRSPGDSRVSIATIQAVEILVGK